MVTVDRRNVTLLAIVGAVVVGGVALFLSVPAGNSGRAAVSPAGAGKVSAGSSSTTTSTTQLPPLQPDGTVTAGRPPQFVNVSFDGAGGLELLQQWLDVANRGHARFSFFLSGVYLLDQAHKTLYVGPHHKPGASSVGFANVPPGMTSEQYMSTLVQKLTDARRIGHEVGTHYNGHFCSGVSNPVGTWNGADWTNEIDQFYGFAANISRNNGFTQQIPSPLDPKGVVGGRTPCLEGDMDALYPVLAQKGFRYDASRTGTAGQWPQKHLGLWSMTLDSIPLVGLGRTQLSMDYNLFYGYSGAKNVDAQRSAQISENAYQSYVHYFENSYYGNRAPIDLGNHFERWDNSAFTNALERFVLEECVKPEVRCVPYRDLVDWLDARPPQQLAAFEAGAFPPLPRPGQPPPAAPPAGPAQGSSR